MYISWPVKIQVLKVGARVATGCGVLRWRGPGNSRDEIAVRVLVPMGKMQMWKLFVSSQLAFIVCNGNCLTMSHGFCVGQLLFL